MRAQSHTFTLKNEKVSLQTQITKWTELSWPDITPWSKRTNLLTSNISSGNKKAKSLSCLKKSSSKTLQSSVLVITSGLKVNRAHHPKKKTQKIKFTVMVVAQVLVINSKRFLWLILIQWVTTTKLSSRFLIIRRRRQSSRNQQTRWVRSTLSYLQIGFPRKTSDLSTDLKKFWERVILEQQGWHPSLQTLLLSSLLSQSQELELNRTPICSSRNWASSCPLTILTSLSSTKHSSTTNTCT